MDNIETNETEPASQEKPKLPLPDVEFDKSLEDAPYVVSMNREQLAALLLEFGMSDEDVAKLRVVLTREFEPSEPGVGGRYQPDAHRIIIAFNPLWEEYLKSQQLSQKIVNKRLSPNKNRFKKILYTNKLPKYLAEAPPERGLQFAQKLLLNGLVRRQNEVLHHESSHALDIKSGRIKNDFVHNILRTGALSKFTDPLGAVTIVGGWALGMPEAASLGASVIFISRLIELNLGLTGEEQSAKKFASSLKNNPSWRSIITVGPKAVPQSTLG